MSFGEFRILAPSRPGDVRTWTGPRGRGEELFALVRRPGRRGKIRFAFEALPRLTSGERGVVGPCASIFQYNALAPGRKTEVRGFPEVNRQIRSNPRLLRVADRRIGSCGRVGGEPSRISGAAPARTDLDTASIAASPRSGSVAVRYPTSPRPVPDACRYPREPGSRSSGSRRPRPPGWRSPR